METGSNGLKGTRSRSETVLSTCNAQFLERACCELWPSDWIGVMYVALLLLWIFISWCESSLTLGCLSELSGLLYTTLPEWTMTEELCKEVEVTMVEGSRSYRSPHCEVAEEDSLLSRMFSFPWEGKGKFIRWEWWWACCVWRVCLTTWGDKGVTEAVEMSTTLPLMSSCRQGGAVSLKLFTGFIFRVLFLHPAWGWKVHSQWFPNCDSDFKGISQCLLTEFISLPKINPD